MTGLVIAGFAAGIIALWAADRLVKTTARARRRRVMRSRLAAAAVTAEEQQAQRRSAVRASKALTSVIPAIQRPPLKQPATAPRGLPSPVTGPQRAARPRNRRENTGPQATHPGRRPSRSGSEHTSRPGGH